MSSLRLPTQLIPPSLRYPAHFAPLPLLFVRLHRRSRLQRKATNHLQLGGKVYVWLHKMIIKFPYFAYFTLQTCEISFLPPLARSLFPISAAFAPQSNYFLAFAAANENHLKLMSFLASFPPPTRLPRLRLVFALLHRRAWSK